MEAERGKSEELSGAWWGRPVPSAESESAQPPVGAGRPTRRGEGHGAELEPCVASPAGVWPQHLCTALEFFLRHFTFAALYTISWSWFLYISVQ